MRNIAKELGRSVSTLSDELKRNLVKGKYVARKAQHKAYVRRRRAKYQGKKIVEHLPLREFVEDRLYDGQSPLMISGRIKHHEPHLPDVSKDSIYRYIGSVYGRRIEYYREKRRPKWRRHQSPRATWLNRKFINERPQTINARQRVGDAEGDFIVSGKSGTGILLVVVDRRHRVTFLEQILKPSTAAVTRACLRIQKRYPEWRTMTADNDILFQHHETLEKKLNITIYFCQAYHSWEKGTVENTNKRIRKDIPKSSDISRYSKRFIRALEAKLNRRIMRCLKYRTPDEMLERYRKRKKRRGAGKNSDRKKV